VRQHETDSDLITADMVIGFKVFRERFTSRARLDPDGRRIDVAYEQGPFKYLNNHWVFEDHPQGCTIDFYVDFAFRSRILQKLIEPLFSEAVRRMVSAFETRARALYGAPGAQNPGPS
jgi:coenzyme Q-binding protein COQ10